MIIYRVLYVTINLATLVIQNNCNQDVIMQVYTFPANGGVHTEISSLPHLFTLYLSFLSSLVECVIINSVYFRLSL